MAVDISAATKHSKSSHAYSASETSTFFLAAIDDDLHESSCVGSPQHERIVLPSGSDESIGSSSTASSTSTAASSTPSDHKGSFMGWPDPDNNDDDSYDGILSDFPENNSLGKSNVSKHNGSITKTLKEHGECLLRSIDRTSRSRIQNLNILAMSLVGWNIEPQPQHRRNINNNSTTDTDGEFLCEFVSRSSFQKINNSIGNSDQFEEFDSRAPWKKGPTRTVESKEPDDVSLASSIHENNNNHDSRPNDSLCQKDVKRISRVASVASSLGDEESLSSDITELVRAQEALFSVPEHDESSDPFPLFDDEESYDDIEHDNEIDNFTESKVDVVVRPKPSRPAPTPISLALESVREEDEEFVQSTPIEKRSWGSPVLDDLYDSSPETDDTDTYSDVDMDDIPSLRIYMEVHDADIEKEFGTIQMEDINFEDCPQKKNYEEEDDLEMLFEGGLPKNNVDEDVRRSSKLGGHWSSRRTRATQAVVDKLRPIKDRIKKQSGSNHVRRRHKRLWKFFVWNCRKIMGLILFCLLITVGVFLSFWFGARRAQFPYQQVIVVITPTLSPSGTGRDIFGTDPFGGGSSISPSESSAPSAPPWVLGLHIPSYRPSSISTSPLAIDGPGPSNSTIPSPTGNSNTTSSLPSIHSNWNHPTSTPTTIIMRPLSPSGTINASEIPYLAGAFLPSSLLNSTSFLTPSMTGGTVLPSSSSNTTSSFSPSGLINASTLPVVNGGALVPGSSSNSTPSFSPSGAINSSTTSPLNGGAIIPSPSSNSSPSVSTSDPINISTTPSVGGAIIPSLSSNSTPSFSPRGAINPSKVPSLNGAALILDSSSNSIPSNPPISTFNTSRAPSLNGVALIPGISPNSTPSMPPSNALYSTISSIDTENMSKGTIRYKKKRYRGPSLWG